MTRNATAPTTVTRRHSVATRILHWVNALCVFAVLMSGLQIFNAHPRLYWGAAGANFDPPLLEIAPPGEQAFPGWATIPSWYDLAAGRRWHFFFAWLLAINSLVYVAASVATRHLQRDLVPRRAELSWTHIGASIHDHARLRFPRGEHARHYNVLQKLAYLCAIFVLAPLVLLTGLTLSPGMDSAAPWLVELWGGRQSARTLHFFAAAAVALFVLIHLTMVILAGPWNELRSMITGRYTLPAEKPPP
jgi:thiosulfate reductase cytochrome b subunit